MGNSISGPMLTQKIYTKGSMQTGYSRYEILKGTIVAILHIYGYEAISILFKCQDTDTE